VLPEPWHLSYGPASVPALNALTPEVLARAVAASDMLGREIVLERLDDIHHRYVAGVDDPANEQRETFHGFPP
jgi:hypothetical protein